MFGESSNLQYIIDIVYYCNKYCFATRICNILILYFVFCNQYCFATLIGPAAGRQMASGEDKLSFCLVIILYFVFCNQYCFATLRAAAGRQMASGEDKFLSWAAYQYWRKIFNTLWRQQWPADGEWRGEAKLAQNINTLLAHFCVRSFILIYWRKISIYIGAKYQYR